MSASKDVARAGGAGKHQPTPAWPALPVELPVTLPSGDSGVLRLLDADTATRVDSALAECVPSDSASPAELGHFMTRPPFPLSSFIQDATRFTYGFFDNPAADELPVAMTSIYDVDQSAQEATMGFTVVAPHARGRGLNAAMKLALFDELAEVGIRAVWFRMDGENRAAARGVRAVGAVFSHVGDDPRAYPDGRVGKHHFYRRQLRPTDWVFAASNGFAQRLDQRGMVQALAAALHAPADEMGLEWIQLQHASQPGVFLAFDAAGPGSEGAAATSDSAVDPEPNPAESGDAPLWRVSADDSTRPALDGLLDRPLTSQDAIHALDRVL